MPGRHEIDAKFGVPDGDLDIALPKLVPAGQNEPKELKIDPLCFP